MKKAARRFGTASSWIFVVFLGFLSMLLPSMTDAAEITFFGIATPDGTVLAPADSAPDLTPIYWRPSGKGFLIVLEAMPGDDLSPPGTIGTGGMVPASGSSDLQMRAGNDLGNGSVAVCDVGPTGGGVPGSDPPDFGPSADDAINDLACRFTVATSGAFACTKNALGNFDFVHPGTTHQYCLNPPVPTELTFPSGLTRLTAQVRSESGQVGAQASIIVRVEQPPAGGPEITYFGIAAPDGTVLTPEGTAPDETPIYSRPFGIGFHVVLEAQPGADLFPPGTIGTGGMVPVSGSSDLQMRAGNDLGNGSVAVCDVGATGGGVPGSDPPDFGPSADDAINDLACRFIVATSGAFACTKDVLGNFDFVHPSTTHQYCLNPPVPTELTFPSGVTRLTAQVRSESGQVGVQESIIVRVEQPPAFGCPPSPATCPAEFDKGLLLIRERIAGKEAIVARFNNGPPLTQASFGNPLSIDGTAYGLCIYGDDDILVGALIVDRAGEICGTKACWDALGKDPPDGTGFEYRDRERMADGVEILELRGGGPGKSALLVTAKNDSRKGQTAMPTGIGVALEGDTSATIQLHTSDASCFSATVTGRF